ncbi:MULTISPECIES: mechanosensitive ion channel family protein [Bacillus]|uniref:Mechanosensitive ion channel protein MscS n=2 Tax=Bacillus TaxID=1386 RepID=A0A0M4FUJ5_9BACI|nr:MULTISPECIES: mechanosensitive ion channel family protein [Bacillus]ALC80175.1 mechanosensitive ion channel protein MscS [Bacillus gobiensis]MBP1082849.1 small conductance mechanosensitive channel [Bacillus capparidis]MED1098489.1 mechanosensitive ion channel family protein [Bacillus capparidis]
MVEALKEWKVVEMVVVGLILWASVFIINKLVHKFFVRTDFIAERNEKTIESLIRSVTRYTATFGFVLYVISLFIDDFGKILAGAGIAGIVIGFGAQSLIKDILAGIFLIYERQLHQGDVVTVNNTFTGAVEELGLRSLKIREWSGKLLTISNGEVRQIQNYNIQFMRITERVVISFKENPERVYQILEDLCEELNEELKASLKNDHLGQPTEPFQVHGITSMNSVNRGIEFTIKGVVKDDDYFESSLFARRKLAQKLYENDVQMLEEAVRIMPQKKN